MHETCVFSSLRNTWSNEHQDRLLFDFINSIIYYLILLIWPSIGQGFMIKTEIRNLGLGLAGGLGLGHIFKNYPFSFLSHD